MTEFSDPKLSIVTVSDMVQYDASMFETNHCQSIRPSIDQLSILNKETKWNQVELLGEQSSPPSSYPNILKQIFKKQDVVDYKKQPNDFYAYENVHYIDDVDDLQRNQIELKNNSTQWHNHKTIHCHEGIDDEHQRHHSSKAMYKLTYGLILCASFMITELIGGYFSHSLAIFTDAAHLFSDMVSFAISLGAIYLGQKRPTQKKSFGYQRIEVLGVMISVFCIWFITLILVYFAIERMITNEFEIHSLSMLIIASIGLGMNLLMWFVMSDLFENIVKKIFGKSSSNSRMKCNSESDLHDEHDEDNKDHSHQHHSHHHHESHNDRKHESQHDHQHGHQHGHHHGSHHGHSHMNMNVRAAILHIIGDIIQSIGVLTAAIIIHFYPKYKMADPICTILFALLVFGTTYNIMTDAIHILMEGFPNEYTYDSVKRLLLDQVSGVRHVHSLHIWSLTHGQHALTVHLSIEPQNNHQHSHCFETIRHEAEKLIRKELSINQTTIQIELHQEQKIKNCYNCALPE